MTSFGFTCPFQFSNLPQLLSTHVPGADPANSKVPAMNAVPPTGGIPDRTAFNGAPGGFREETAAGPEALILLGVSAAILLVGILLVKRYRRWGG